MNKKGIFLNFMVFLLVMAILGLHNTTSRTSSGMEENLVESAAFDTMNNSFNNIFEEIVNLNKDGFAKDVQQRSMPFEYDLNRNKIGVKQLLPQRSDVLKGYIDGLNIYSIYANSQVTESKIEMETTLVAQNSEWGTIEMPEFPDLNYLILPQCLFYDINGGGKMLLRAGLPGEERCEKHFEFEDLNSVYLLVLFNSTNYTSGTLTCGNEFQIAGACLSSAFDPASSEPYMSVSLVERCPTSGCRVLTGAPPYAFKKIAAHFEPAADEFGTISIETNPNIEIQIKVGKQHTGDNFPVYIDNQELTEPIEVDLNVFFDQKIQLFYFTGFAISASKENFSVLRST